MNNSTQSLTSLSDIELLEKCNFYGVQARRWRNKFLGLLPEVARRELYRSRGFGTIFEFAFRIGGVSKEQVERVLNIEDSLRKAPLLREMLIRGEVSVSKISRVVSIASTENQVELAEHVRVLPQAALETLVRDFRAERSANEALATDSSFVRAHKIDNIQQGDILTRCEANTGSRYNFLLNEEAQKKLQELSDKDIDVSAFILEAAKKREEEIEQRKLQIAEKMADAKPARSRHIPASVRRLLEKEHGTKCAIPTCRKLSKEIHHTARHSLSRSHDPRFLAPLCKEHHILAHHVDLKYQEKRKM